jgi:hypothetical protein
MRFYDLRLFGIGAAWRGISFFARVYLDDGVGDTKMIGTLGPTVGDGRGEGEGKVCLSVSWIWLWTAEPVRISIRVMYIAPMVTP